MQLTETTLDIVAFLGKQPFTPKTIRSISLGLDKAYPLIHSHIQSLLQEKLILQERVGRSCRCTLNLAHIQTQLLLGFTTSRTQTSQEKKIFQQIEQHQKILSLCTVAHTKETLFLVTETSKKECKNIFPYTGVVICSPQEFKKHLLALAKNNTFPTPILGAETFYTFLAHVQKQYFHWGGEE